MILWLPYLLVGLLCSLFCFSLIWYLCVLGLGFRLLFGLMFMCWFSLLVVLAFMFWVGYGFVDFTRGCITVWVLVLVYYVVLRWFAGGVWLLLRLCLWLFVMICCCWVSLVLWVALFELLVLVLAGDFGLLCCVLGLVLWILLTFWVGSIVFLLFCWYLWLRWFGLWTYVDCLILGFAAWWNFRLHEFWDLVDAWWHIFYLGFVVLSCMFAT